MWRTQFKDNILCKKKTTKNKIDKPFGIKKKKHKKECKMNRECTQEECKKETCLFLMATFLWDFAFFNFI